MTAGGPEQPDLGSYTPEALAACQKALRTLLARIGPWGTNVVLVGGLVPQYLVPNVPDGITAHVGTTDLDLVIGIIVTTDDEETYRTLQTNLIDARFHPATNEEGNVESFRWQRDDVDGLTVTVEFFCPVGDGTPGRLLRRPVDGAGSRLSAIRLEGAELAAGDYLAVPLPGEVLDLGGRRDDIEVRAANVLPFISLKALAIAEREKDKDAYDLVWTIAALGPDHAVESAARSPVLDDPVVRKARHLLAEHFATIESIGPSRYARFFLGTAGEPDSRDQLRRYAHGAVQEYLRAWASAGLP